jgi:tRNA dimethylallyltransferase
MFSSPFSNALVLTGPTGSGKSELGVELAEKLDAEIVSMDSMALYRGMDIGTAKPGAELRQRVPHHLLDVREPWQSANVAWWLTEAGNCVRLIESRRKRALFVGGTPLYLKALIYGLFDGPPADLELRRRLTDESQQAGAQALHERLAMLDPAAAKRLHPNDVRRIIRALEVLELTGRPLSNWQQQWKAEPSAEHTANVESPPQVLWLDLPRAELYARIDARVGQMMKAGLLEEVRQLRALPHPISREAAQALGYKELFAHLEGQSSLAKAVVRIQTRSRNFAKRQITWFRHLPNCRPVTRELTFTLWGSKMEC